MKPMNLVLYVLLVLLATNCGRQKSNKCQSSVNDPYPNPPPSTTEWRLGYVNLALVHSETGNPFANSRIYTQSGDSTTNEMGELFISQTIYYIPKDYSDIYYKHPIYFSVSGFFNIVDSVLWAFNVEDTKTYRYNLIPNMCYYYAILFFTNSQTGEPIANTTFHGVSDDTVITDNEGRIEAALPITKPNQESTCLDSTQISIWAWSEGYWETELIVIGTANLEDAHTYHFAIKPD